MEKQKTLHNNVIQILVCGLFLIMVKIFLVYVASENKQKKFTTSIHNFNAHIVYLFSVFCHIFLEIFSLLCLLFI